MEKKHIIKIEMQDGDGVKVNVDLTNLTEIEIDANVMLSAKCNYCSGKGRVEYIRGMEGYEEVCPECNGRGRLDILDLTDCLPQ